MTTYSRMPKVSSNLSYTTRKSNQFEIEIDLFETPEYQDYWSAFYRASHANYGNVGFQAIFPKEKYPDFVSAQRVFMAQPLDRVKSILEDANGDEFSRNLYISPDGWLLM